MHKTETPHQKLRELLKQRPHTPKELVTRSGYCHREVSTVLFEIGKEGKLRKNEMGQLILTPSSSS